MHEILIGEQETVTVGTIVAKISTGAIVVVESKKEVATEKKVEAAEPVLMHDNFAKLEMSEREKVKGEGKQFYSPLVLSIAQKENVSFDELKNVKGSGLEGRVTKKDILSYIEYRSNR